MSCPFRSSVLVFALAALTVPASARAQGFGLGLRIASIRGDVDVDPAATATRFTGGQIRARVSPRTALELSLDWHSETNPAETQRVRDYPLQASLLLYPIKGAFSPFLLGGAGWYTHKLESLSDGHVTSSASTTKMGWHAGFGAEAVFGHHVGVHGDYRYTFLNWEHANVVSLTGLVPSYRGSMWTAGMTFYF
jgi:opacity protein-like surface antigen